MPESPTSAYAEPFLLTATYTAHVTDQDSASTTIAAGSNGVNLASAPGTIFVADTSALAAAGIVKITSSLGDQYVTYTGKVGGGTPNLTGCVGGVGIISTGGAVVQVRVVSFVGGSLWWRMFLCPTAGTGASATDPKEWIAYVKTQIRGGSTRWNLAMQLNGHPLLTHVGSGTGTIAWVTPYVVPVSLGFPSTAISLASGLTLESTYTPCFMMFIQGRSNDTGWQEEPTGEAGAVMPDGDVDYRGDGYTLSRRGYTLARLPRCAGIVTSNVTPMFPIDTETTRRKQPSLSALPTNTPTQWNTAYQWSVLEFIAVGMGHRIAVSHGFFQLYASGNPDYDICSFDPSTRDGKAVHSTAYWSERMDRPGVEVLWYGTANVT